MRSIGTVWPTRYRQDAFMELTIAFEGELLGGLVAGNMHVARKGDLLSRRSGEGPPLSVVR